MANEMKQSDGSKEAYRMFIGDQWVDASDGARMDVENPTTEEIIYSVPNGTAEDAQAALQSATDAQKAWAKLPAVERGNHLITLAAKIRENQEHLAKILVAEQGKTLGLAMGEVRIIRL